MKRKTVNSIQDSLQQVKDGKLWLILNYWEVDERFEIIALFMGQDGIIWSIINDMEEDQAKDCRLDRVLPAEDEDAFAEHVASVVQGEGEELGDVEQNSMAQESTIVNEGSHEVEMDWRAWKMFIEGTSEEEYPDLKWIRRFARERGFEIKNLDAIWDSLMNTWRFHGDLVEISKV